MDVDPSLTYWIFIHSVKVSARVGKFRIHTGVLPGTAILSRMSVSTLMASSNVIGVALQSQIDRTDTERQKGHNTYRFPHNER